MLLGPSKILERDLEAVFDWLVRIDSQVGVWWCDRLHSLVKDFYSGLTGHPGSLSKPAREALWQLSIDEELHGSTRWILCTWLRRAAKSKAARISSDSRSS